MDWITSVHDGTDSHNYLRDCCGQLVLNLVIDLYFCFTENLFLLHRKSLVLRVYVRTLTQDNKPLALTTWALSIGWSAHLSSENNKWKVNTIIFSISALSMTATAGRSKIIHQLCDYILRLETSEGTQSSILLTEKQSECTKQARAKTQKHPSWERITIKRLSVIMKIIRTGMQ